MKVNVVILGVIVSTIFIYSNDVLAEKRLTIDEVTALFKNKTYEVHKESKNKQYQVYSADDGTYSKKKKSGKIKRGTWKVDSKGRHCVEFKKEKCSKVIEVGNGIYHKITNGEHTHTLKNFVSGNKL